MDWGAWKGAGAVVVVVGAGVWTNEITTFNPPPGPVQVTYWEKWSAFEQAAMQKVVDTFNASQNKIHVDMLSVSGVENKTLMAVAGGDPPDVAGLYGGNLAQYADDAAIQPLDDFCKQAGITPDQYIHAYIDICTYNDHIWALPSTPASTALHYNKKMLAAAGIAKPPETIEELDDDCDIIFKKDPDGKLISAGFVPGEPGWWNFLWGSFFGGKLWDGKGKITANDPQNVAALTWIQHFTKKYGNSTLQSFRSGFGQFNSPQNAFLDEKVAMEMQGVWMANFIEKNNPKLEWGAVPFPYPKDRPDLKGSTIADLDILTIPRGAHHPQEAFEFIKYVESQKGMELLCLGQRKNSPLKQVSPGFYETHPNPYIRLFNDMPLGKNTYAVPKIGIWPEYQAALNDAVDEVTLLQKTPQEALDDVQRKFQPELDEHLERLRQRGVIK